MINVTKKTDFAIVTVRNSSSRLPNKAIMPIKGKIRSIDIVIERAKKTDLPVVVATSTHKSDDIFEVIAKEHCVKLFRGSLINKIKRWYDCFNYFNVDNALLLDGDDLCHNYNIGKRAMHELKSKPVDMIINPPDIVTGFFTYAVKRSAIEKMYDVTSSEDTNTDVITRYIEKAKLTTDFVTLKNYERNERIRMTLDYEEDLRFFRKLYENLDIVEDAKNILHFLETHSEIIQINLHRQKDFLENQARFNDSVQ